jgi:drug/metabolite transporter (DMT)-like permease
MFSIFSAFMGAFGFGTANVVIKKSLGSLSIPQTLMMSTLSGIGWLLLFLMATRAGLLFSLQDVLLAGGLALAEVTLYLVLYRTFAVSQVTVAIAVSGTYPILAAIIAAVLFQEVIGAQQWLAIAVLVVGALLVSVNWAELRDGKLDGNELAKGWPWILATTLIHALYFPLLGQFTSQGSWESKLLLIKLFSALILWLGFVVLRRERVLPPQNKIAFTSLLGLLELLGWVGYSWATSASTGQTAILIAILKSSTLITAVWAYFVLNEKLSKLQYLGIGLIVAGLSWLSLG